jgi:general secretion pathway protein H
MTGAAEKDRAGFSLIEMLVVLLITALATGILAWGMNGLKERQTTRAVALKLAEVMMAAHWRALQTGDEQSVTLDLENDRALDPDGRKAVDIPGQMKLVVTIGRETVTDRRRLKVIFLPDGTSSGAMIRLGRGSDSASLRTNWLTGLTEVGK